MSFHAATHAAQYQHRPGRDAAPELYHARLAVCENCPHRHGHNCEAANPRQLCSILARPAKTVCPARSFPGDPPQPTVSLATPRQQSAAIGTPRGLLSCAVIIISHNYGRFLAEAIESVLQQTVRPAELIVIDDASTDETAAVAQSYGDRGATYIRVETRSVTRNRLHGLQLTTAPVVVFLDADDTLPPDYLERGLPLFDRPEVGIVYSDCQRFGDDTSYVKFPEPTARNIVHQNFAHAGSLVRRAALEASEALSQPDQVSRLNQDDWYLWRRIATAGWRLEKSTAVYQYRIHSSSHCAELKGNAVGYFDLASLQHETITLFIPLSGRRWAWPAMREFLETQRWPRDQIRLVLCDTSNSAVFNAELRGWLQETEYDDVRLYRQTVGRQGLADDNRYAHEVRRSVQAAMPLIYNRMAREATTEYVWIVEDDILPPIDAAERLLKSFNDQVASVSGAYPSRYRTHEFVAWDRTGKGFARDATCQPGVTAVGGNGFGCVILRRSVMQQTVFQHTSPVSDYDPNFYHWLANTGRWRALVDWSVQCDHRSGSHDDEGTQALRIISPEMDGPASGAARPRV